MQFKKLNEDQKEEYNKHVTHVIQSWEWGEFRKSIGTPVLRYGLYDGRKLVSAFQLTLHKIPFTKSYVGYLPKGPFPNHELAETLKQIAKEQNCAFIKLEPNVLSDYSSSLREVSDNERRGNLDSENEIPTSPTAPLNDIDPTFYPSPKPLFTKYNFVLDLTQSEEQILKNMHPKTRYNIKIAQKNQVKVEERTDNEALEIYLQLYFDTTKRQGYHGHTPDYHKKVWETLKRDKMARFLIAFYEGKPLTAWMLLNFKDTLYYPYGGSSPQHREIMHSNIVAWEAIKLGKKLKLKNFDMWGALGPNADKNDPWYGFHRFKQGYGGELVEYIGTYDLVFNHPLYYAFTIVDRMQPLKLFLLKFLH